MYELIYVIKFPDDTYWVNGGLQRFSAIFTTFNIKHATVFSLYSEARQICDKLIKNNYPCEVYPLLLKEVK